MKIYTLSYYSDIVNSVVGSYSSFTKAKNALINEAAKRYEILNYINSVECPAKDYGRYPVNGSEKFHAYYEIDCNTLNDENEEEKYDEEYFDEEGYEDGEDDE